MFLCLEPSFPFLFHQANLSLLCSGLLGKHVRPLGCIRFPNARLVCVIKRRRVRMAGTQLRSLFPPRFLRCRSRYSPRPSLGFAASGRPRRVSRLLSPKPSPLPCWPLSTSSDTPDVFLPRDLCTGSSPCPDPPSLLRKLLAPPFPPPGLYQKASFSAPTRFKIYIFVWL